MVMMIIRIKNIYYDDDTDTNSDDDDDDDDKYDGDDADKIPFEV
jgi:hypothetical protein